LTNLNIFNFGVEIGRVLNSNIQTAILENEDDINSLLELSAINRSAFIKVSSNRIELLEWLS
jgi:predicted aspartyl protease